MQAEREEKNMSTNPRVCSGSRWLAYRQGSWVVLQETGSAWEVQLQQMVLYVFLVEETGEKIEVQAETIWESINAKKMTEIGLHKKEDILSGRY